MQKSVFTPKGTELPLLNLKGKAYLMGAFRLQWFNEEVERFTIDTEFLLINQDETICRSKVCIFNKEGQLLKQATATKRETKKDFPDHTEKAESSSIFRCLAMLGFGTQFALSDLDEGNRLADTPLEFNKPKTAPQQEHSETKSEASPEPQQEAKPAAPKAKWTPKKKAEPKPETEGDGW